MRVNFLTKKQSARLHHIEMMLERVLEHQQQLLIKGGSMSEALDRLEASVAGIEGVTKSTEHRLEVVAAEIRENRGDEAAQVALADRLDERRSALAAAVKAFPAPEEVPPPVEDPGPDEVPGESLAGATGEL